MRTILVVLALVAAGLALDPGAQAEITYPWCGQYGEGGNSGRNCGFSTLEQCRAAISGNGGGGYCEQNPMYRPGADVPPARTRPRR